MYCDQTYLEQRFGPANIAKWADLDNDGDAAAIAERIATALELATDEIDDELRGGACDIPFEDTPSTPRRIQNICAGIAGCWLYEARGSADADPEGDAADRMSPIRKDCKDQLRRIKAGTLRLDTTMRTATPFVVPVDTDTLTDNDTVVDIRVIDETGSWT
jgi:phage gp36-like protein